MKNTIVMTLPLLFLLCPLLSAQDIYQERIRKLTGSKAAVFLDSGIIHNGSVKRSSVLKAVRHSYKKSLGYERVVLDFTTKKIPRVYGLISGKDKKLYLDLFDTDLPDNVESFGTSKFVESVNFFPLDNESLSVEVLFKKGVNLDVFYLETPGRLVIDIKG